MKEKPFIIWVQWFLYTSLFIGMISSFRAVTSMSIGALPIVNLWTAEKPYSPFRNKTFVATFLALCLLYVLNTISLTYSNNFDQGLKTLRIQSGLLIIPLMVGFQRFNDRFSPVRLMQLFCCLLLCASVYCVAHATFHLLVNKNSSFFFYHELVSPLHQHAVYFSVLVCIVLFYLAETALSKAFILNRFLHLTVLCWFSMFLFLLSSKFVISAFILYLVYILVSQYRKRVIPRRAMITYSASFLLGFAILLSIKNPVSARFADLFEGKMNLIAQDRFQQKDYFNGLQFRLLQWWFTADILSTNRSWIRGVGVGDVQYELDQQYIKRNMYIGDQVSGSQGYLIYNSHNQFLQATLASGLLGLVALLGFCACLLLVQARESQRSYTASILLLILWMFSESVFETQYGVLILTFFPLFLQRLYRQINSPNTR